MLNINIYNIGNALVGFNSSVNREVSMQIKAASQGRSKETLALPRIKKYSTRSRYPRRRYVNQIKREYERDK